MANDDRYHHGNLRQALIDAGLDILEERGVDGVTLREAARRAGVSHAAPYHHFSDKANLIESIAVHGFEGFARALQRAWESTSGNALERLQSTGIAYVAFALGRPALFRLMNRQELRTPRLASDNEPGPVEQAAHASYQILVDGIIECQAAGLIARGDPNPYALTAWSLVHGLAVLGMDGLIIDREPTVEAGEQLARMATGVLGQGLMVR
ncbi:MAG: TetR/AcrR family transcriptional regulator [Trueperaceae bacterium]